MAHTMKALAGPQAKPATSRVAAARPVGSVRRPAPQQRRVAVATAAPDAPESASKQQILKEIEEANAQLSQAGVDPELFAVWDDEAEEEGEEADIAAADDGDDDDADYDGPEALVTTLYDEQSDRLLGTQVLYEVNGELVTEGPETDELLKDNFPAWFANAVEEVDEAEADDAADEDGEDVDVGEVDEADRRELEAALDNREEAIELLRSWTPEMLEELYPNGKVPGFNKKQSKDLWRALRYFLAVEAVDTAYEVQNLEGKEGLVELDDDNDFEEEDMDEDTADDVALYDEYDALARDFDLAFKPKDRVYGTVYRVTEDGAYVELPGKSSGYVPLSECSTAKLSTPTEALSVGVKREFVVLEVDDIYGEVILSLRSLESDVLWARIAQLQDEDVTVYVTVTDFNMGGLTVEYNNIEGFIPQAQFGSALQLESMEELVGVQVPVKFLEAHPEEERIVFSNKRAASDGYSQTFAPGDVLPGVIQSVKPYGAFVDLGGVTGLLHISQISHERVMDVTKVFSEGDKLKVMVLSTDKDRGRVTLSTKKLEPTPGDMLRAADLVYEKAEEIAAQFKERMQSAQNISMDGSIDYESMDNIYEAGAAPAAGGYIAQQFDAAGAPLAAEYGAPAPGAVQAGYAEPAAAPAYADPAAYYQGGAEGAPAADQPQDYQA